MRFEAIGRVVLAAQKAGVPKVGFITEPRNDVALSASTFRQKGYLRHGNECRYGSGEGEVMVEMNTTPLIDVMLVLLVMLIITIPIQTHAVKLDMPPPNQPPPPVPPRWSI